MAKAAKIGFSVAGAGFHPAAESNSHFGSAIVTLDIGDSHFDLSHLPEFTGMIEDALL